MMQYAAEYFPYAPIPRSLHKVALLSFFSML